MNGADKSAFLLDGMYKSVKIGSERLICALPRVQDRAMIRDVTESLERYSEFSGRLEEMMRRRGIEPAAPSFLSKIGARAGVCANTVIDSTPKNVARLCAGTARGSLARLERMRDEVPDCDCAVMCICEDIIAREKINCQKMEAYL